VNHFRLTPAGVAALKGGMSLEDIMYGQALRLMENVVPPRDDGNGIVKLLGGYTMTYGSDPTKGSFHEWKFMSPVETVRGMYAQDGVGTILAFFHRDAWAGPFLAGAVLRVYDKENNVIVPG